MIICYRRICKTIEFCKLIHILPDLAVIGMENMCAIFMYMNLLDILRINISRNIRTLIDH